jgi:hypothetical protein
MNRLVRYRERGVKLFVETIVIRIEDSRDPIRIVRSDYQPGVVPSIHSPDDLIVDKRVQIRPLLPCKRDNDPGVQFA